MIDVVYTTHTRPQREKEKDGCYHFYSNKDEEKDFLIGRSLSFSKRYLPSCSLSLFLLKRAKNNCIVRHI